MSVSVDIKSSSSNIKKFIKIESLCARVDAVGELSSARKLSTSRETVDLRGASVNF
jgi:hypothetical protein